MSVLQFSACVLNDNWSEFVEWCAHTFDMPVACRFDDQGWGRLAATSPGVTVISGEHFKNSRGGEQTVVELEVTGVKSHATRAVEAGAEIITEPEELAPNLWHAAVRTPQGVVLWLLQSSDDGEDGPVNDGPLNFTVARVVEAPVEEVFAAATQKAHLEKTFVTSADQDIDDAAAEVTWSWEEYGDAQLNVVEFRPNEFVAFHWKADRQSYHTRTQFAFTRLGDGRARIAITESGWNDDARGRKSAFSHCEGWTQFVDSLKIYLEHGIAANG